MSYDIFFYSGLIFLSISTFLLKSLGEVDRLTFDVFIKISLKFLFKFNEFDFSGNILVDLIILLFKFTFLFVLLLIFIEVFGVKSILFDESALNLKNFLPDSISTVLLLVDVRLLLSSD